MSSSEKPADDLNGGHSNSSARRLIAIVGGGIIGVCTAYYLTQHPSYSKDKYRIVIIEATDIAAAASGKAGGLIASDMHTTSTIDLARLSSRLHRELADQYGGFEQWGYRAVDAWWVSINRDSKKPAQLPVDIKWINHNIIDDFSHEGTTETMTQVQPRRFTQFLFGQCKSAGAELMKGLVERIDESCKLSIKLEDNKECELKADDVIVAAGPWTGKLLTDFEMIPERSHSITLTQPPHPSPHVLFVDSQMPADNPRIFEIYSRPDEFYVCGCSDHLRLPERADQVEIDERCCDLLYNSLKQLSDEWKDVEVTRKQACYLPRLKSRATPVIGKFRQNIYVASGHSMWGICLAPGTGKVLSEIYFGETKLSASIDRCRP